MALHVRDVAAERGVKAYEVDAENIVFEDRVSRRYYGRGVFNVSPASVAKWAVRHRRDMGKKAPQSMFTGLVTGPLACEIEPALIVGCNAIKMRDLDVGVRPVIKVVRRPVRSHLSRRIPTRQVSMVDSVGICVTVAAGNGVTRPAVVPDSVRGNAYRRFYQLLPGIRGYVVYEGPAYHEVRIKVADDKSPHCAMDDRVEDLLTGEKRAAIIDRLPRARSVGRSFVEQTVIPNISAFIFTFRIAADDTHITRRERVWPIEHRAGNGDVGGTRIIQDRPIAAATEGTLVKNPMRSYWARGRRRWGRMSGSRYKNVLSPGAAYACWTIGPSISSWVVER